MNDIMLNIIYATETGQAKAISERLSEILLSNNIKHEVICISDLMNIEKQKLLIFIVSTTGDGEPPEMARKFWRKIKKDKPLLEDLKFSILGLGDSNYTTFMNFPKSLDKLLIEFKATHFLPSKWADDAVGLELVTEDWIFDVVKEIKSQFSQLLNDYDNIKNSNLNCEIFNDHLRSDSQKIVCEKLDLPDVSTMKMDNLPPIVLDIFKRLHLTNDYLSNLNLTLPSCSHILEVEYTQTTCRLYSELSPKFLSYPFNGSDIFEATVISVKNLTQGLNVKQIFAMELKAEPLKELYKPGDAIGIFPRNNPKTSSDILKHLNLDAFEDNVCSVKVSARLNLDPRKIVNKLPPIEGISLKEYFEWVYDLNAPVKKAVLLKFSEFTSNREEKRILEILSSREGSSLYQHIFFDLKFGLVDIFNIFKSCKPPVELLLEHLPRLKPRYYTICSTPLQNDCHIQIVFSILSDLRIGPEYLNQVHNLRELQGVCTTWLKSFNVDLVNDHKVNIYLKKSTNFNPPMDLSIPLIMIGPGTGVAPFLGFLRHRDELIKNLSINIFTLGESWMFFGCRHEHGDYIFREEMEAFVKRGVLSRLITSFSRDNSECFIDQHIKDEANFKNLKNIKNKDFDISNKFDSLNIISNNKSDENLTKNNYDVISINNNDKTNEYHNNTHTIKINPENINAKLTDIDNNSLDINSKDESYPKYVQDNLIKYGTDINRLITGSKCMIFVCGDAKNMSVSVEKAFENILVKHSNLSEIDASAFIKNLRSTGRYKEDVWT